MEKLKKLKFFLQVENGKIIIPSTHLLAVIWGFKKVTRLQFSDDEQIKELLIYAKRYDLKNCVVDKDEMINHLHTIYISKSKDLVMQAMECDSKFMSGKKTDLKNLKKQKYFGELLSDPKYFGELLSYPKCCVDYAMSARNINNSSLNKIPEKISFLSNNLLYGVTNHFLTSYLCCSYSCKKSFSFQKKLYKKICDNNPLFAGELKKYLCRPFLVFLKPGLNIINDAWDNRSGVIFSGIFKKNELTYDESIYYSISRSELYYENKEESKIVACIKRGDRITIDDEIISIFKNNKMICRIMNNKKVLMYWFNFV
jgi:hypothetical protein